MPKKPAMSANTRSVVREGKRLVDSTEELRDILRRYRGVTTTMITRVENGTLMFDAIQQAYGSIVRPELTDALEEFEAARHRARLAMFRLGIEQGSSISEIGRALGISRQLASRLAAEARGVSRAPRSR